jgi:hypothetical protein
VGIHGREMRLAKCWLELDVTVECSDEGVIHPKKIPKDSCFQHPLKQLISNCRNQYSRESQYGEANSTTSSRDLPVQAVRYRSSLDLHAYRGLSVVYDDHIILLKQGRNSPTAMI